MGKKLEFTDAVIKINGVVIGRLKDGTLEHIENQLSIELINGMARGNPGILVKFKDGQYGLAYKKEQTQEFFDKEKKYYHIITYPDFKPVMDENQQPKKVLKDNNTVQRIMGLID